LKHIGLYTAFVASLAIFASGVLSQDAPTTGRGGGTPQQRAEATRSFLGLGPEPDKAKAALGAPLFQQNCSFCHGPQARGAEGPALITSDLVLNDEHGEKLTPFLKVGRPEKGMPSFAAIPDDQLGDIAEFIHLQVEDVANRGTYQIKNILVGNAAEGQTYVAAHCTSCHNSGTFDHIATKFRSPDQLQRGWVWPTAAGDDRFAITANVKMPGSGSISGKVTQVSDFHITIVDSTGQTHSIDREPGVDVELHDPLAAHQDLIMTLKNSDMHNVTAYLETLK
jgi:cytochrome c oxidase cbb3-type subunit III